MRKRHLLDAAAVVIIGVIVVWQIRVSLAHARSQAVFAVMNGIDSAQRSSFQQVWVDASRAGPAHSSPGKFDLHSFTAKLIALDRSKCPADFRAAYEQWLKAVEAAETYSTANGMDDARALFHGTGDWRSAAVVDQLKQTQSHLRETAQRYGVTITGQ